MTETPPAGQQIDPATVAMVAVGGIVGGLVGVVASRLFIRADTQTIDHNRARGPQGMQLSLSMLLPIAIGVISLVRQIGALADEK